MAWRHWQPTGPPGCQHAGTAALAHCCSCCPRDVKVGAEHHNNEAKVISEVQSCIRTCQPWGTPHVGRQILQDLFKESAHSRLHKTRAGADLHHDDCQGDGEAGDPPHEGAGTDQCKCPGINPGPWAGVCIDARWHPAPVLHFYAHGGRKPMWRQGSWFAGVGIVTQVLHIPTSLQTGQCKSTGINPGPRAGVCIDAGWHPAPVRTGAGSSYRLCETMRPKQ